MSYDPRQAILESPMSSFQVRAVGITVGLNALDGFDVLAITFASPGIAAEWALQPGALGIVISMGLIGMAVGSLLLAPIADMIGRRPLMIVCLLAMTAGMLLAATAHDVYSLSLWRVVTGLGIGGILATTNPVAAEYASAKRRALSVSLMAIGYPVGAVLGGAFSAWLLRHYDWRSVFIFGGVASAVFIPIVLAWLPDSVAFLIARRPKNALAQANRTLVKMGHQPMETLPPAPEVAPKAPLVEIFRPDMIRGTVTITLAYFLTITAFYYMQGWIPKIVSDLKFSPSDATTVSVWANVGGALGGAALGMLAHRFGLRPLTVLVMLGAFAFITLFGQTPAELTSLKLATAAALFFANAAVVALYNLIAETFPAESRATGTGFIIGVGRSGAALAPIISGFLFQSGLGRGEVSAIMAVSALLSAIVILFLPRPQAVKA